MTLHQQLRFRDILNKLVVQLTLSVYQMQVSDLNQVKHILMFHYMQLVEEVQVRLQQLIQIVQDKYHLLV